MSSFLDNPFWRAMIKASPIVEQQTEVLRWSRYVENDQVARVQSVGQHVLSTITIISRVIMTNLQHAGLRFDQSLVLYAIIVHDLGELFVLDNGEKFDTLYENKNSHGDLQEYEKFSEIVDSTLLSDSNISVALKNEYLLQHANRDMEGAPAEAQKILAFLRERYPVEAKVFEIIERVGYLVYAAEQLAAGKAEVFSDVLRNQRPHLDRLAQEIPEFGKIFWPVEAEALS